MSSHRQRHMRLCTAFAYSSAWRSTLRCYPYGYMPFSLDHLPTLVVAVVQGGLRINQAKCCEATIGRDSGCFKLCKRQQTFVADTSRVWTIS
eukprot:6210342-Pleurochrysis_carterae.AAC.3